MTVDKIRLGFVCDGCGANATVAVRELYDDERNLFDFPGVLSLDVNDLMGPERHYCATCAAKALIPVGGISGRTN